MKKIFEKIGKPGIVIAILIALVSVFVVAQVINDLNSTLTFTNVVTPGIKVASDTSAAFDMSQYVGKVVFVQYITGAIGTTITYGGKLQHSNNDTANFVGISDSAYTSYVAAGDTVTGRVLRKSLDPRAVRRYVKYIGALSASDTITVGVLAIGIKRYN